MTEYLIGAAVGAVIGAALGIWIAAALRANDDDCSRGHPA